MITTRNFYTTENRVESAINIIKYCLENSVTIGEAEIELNHYHGFVRKVFLSNSVKKSESYKELVKIHNKYLNKTKLTKNPIVKVSIDDTYDKRSSYKVNRDENNKIISYSFHILIKDEKPFIGKLTREQLELIYQYYPYVTTNTVSSYFPYLTFQQFKRVLRCFQITKEKLFPQHIVEEHTEEEIAEFALKNKANAALNKIVEKKASFVEKKYIESQETIQDLQNIQKFIEDSVDKYYNREEEEKPELKDGEFFDNYDRVCYMFYSDIHYGKKYDNPVFGRGFNKDIAHNRMMQIVKKTVEYIKYKNLNKLYTIFGGDLLESMMSNGMRAEHLKHMDVIGVDQLFYAIDSQIKFLKLLRSSLGEKFPIIITFIGGNHDRISEDRDGDSERTGSLIAYNVIQRELREDMYLKVNIPRKPTYVETHNKDNGLSNLCIITHHGDSQIMKRKPSELVNLYGIGTSGYHLIINGHWHSSEIKYQSGTNYMSISLPSVCSVDEFILDRLGHNQLPGFLLGISENSGFSFSNEILH